MATPIYHLHLDAAHLPVPLMDRMIQEGGFHMDDFPHQLKVEGVSVPARHMTKYLYAPTTSQEAKAECLKLQQWVTESGFQGLIQCEFVMEETSFNQQETKNATLLPPLLIKSRPLSKQKGESFKKHEVHLEITKADSSPKVIEALKGCGFQELENETHITFTISGHSREMLTIRKALKQFLKDQGPHITGKLTYEATAFWSLHGVEPETLPMIVDRVMVLQ